jgi:hypothetical protein
LQIENQGFNDGKNLQGIEHVCPHEPNSMLVVWLLIALAMVLERIHRRTAGSAPLLDNSIFCGRMTPPSPNGQQERGPPQIKSTLLCRALSRQMFRNR